MSHDYKKFKLSACGGTFDLFHKGHEEFLLSIWRDSEKIIIGITSDELVEEKHTYEDFETRKTTLEKFISDNKIHADIIKIHDIFGPTLSNKYSFDALFVTSDSLKGAVEINKNRDELGLALLKIITIPLFKTQDRKILSSTRIKNGEVDREGNLYIGKELLSYDHVIEDNSRENLSKPFGQLLKTSDIKKFRSGKIITVGDETTKNFISASVVPHLAVLDLKNNRVRKYENIKSFGVKFKNVFKAINPPGHVTRSLIENIKNGFNSGGAVLVDGEEDLAVIPVVLMSPLGYEVFYGQPGEGVVKIKVTEEKKGEMRKVVSNFRRKVL